MTLSPLILTKAEEDLCAAYSQGAPLVLDGAPVVLGSAGPDSGLWPSMVDDAKYVIAKRVIRASMIHDLLLSDTPVASGQLRQLNITGAAICGPLDLQFAEIDYPVRFTHCAFDSQVKLSEARVRSVSFLGCAAPRIDARHVTVSGDLVLDHVQVTGSLLLAGAHLSDDLHLDSAIISDAGGTEAALDLANIYVQGNIKAENLIVHGKVSMNGASINGVLTMTGAKIYAEHNSDAWDGDGMKVGGELDARGLRATGRVRMIDTRILNLALRDIQIEGFDGALLLDRLKSQGSVFCDRGSRIIGGISAIGIQVGASVYLNRMVAQIPQVPGIMGKDASDVAAVNLRRARIRGDLKCNRSFQSIGGFDLTDAQIGGQASLRGASLRPMGDANGHAAFIVDRSEIGSDLSCDGDFQGTISLRHARVGGEMTINQRDQGPDTHFALAAAGLQVARDVDLYTNGTVDLAGANIAGNITLNLARLDGPEKGATADLSTIRAGVVTLHGIPQSGFLDLTGASVSRLLDSSDDWPADSRIVLDGFVYDEIATLVEKPPKEELRYRLNWLKAGTAYRRTADGYKEVGFTPQPYTQLAATYERAGRDRAGRRILYKMHHEHNKTVVPWSRPYSKLWNWIQDVFLGYGYDPKRALLWLLMLGVLTAAWFTNNNMNGAKQHLGIVEAAILSLGLVLPGTRYDEIEKWQQMNTGSHLIATGLVLCGLLLGATVLAALARMVKR